MSGSHYAPDPSRRFSLEDTAPALSDTVRRAGQIMGTIPRDPDPCTVWTDTVDKRLAALEAQVAALLARLEDGK